MTEIIYNLDALRQTAEPLKFISEEDAKKEKEQYKDEEYAMATRAEAIRMRDELNQAIK
mgnify:CR=1 FL=1